MDKLEIKIKKRRRFIFSAVFLVVAVASLIISCVFWESYRTLSGVLLAVCVLSSIATVVAFSLGMAVGGPDKKRRASGSTSKEKIDEEEFEEICAYDMMDDD